MPTSNTKGGIPIASEIISIGTELLLGNILNTNASYLSRKLAEHGLDLYYITSVGDNPERLINTIKEARQRSKIIITTGGLGPTSDDITREAVAKAFNVPLKTSPTMVKQIEDFFHQRGKTAPECNKKQAQYPEGGRLLINPMGTAPGFMIEDSACTLFALPGVPGEMKAIFEDKVSPELQKYQKNNIIHSRLLRVFGLGESQVESILHDIISSQTNPTIAPMAQTGEVILRITCKEKTKEKAELLIRDVQEKIQARIGNYIYGYDDDTLETVTADILMKRGKTISTAESCTGGLLAHRLTNIPGSSSFYYGGIVAYSNDLKERVLGVKKETLRKFGAVSEEVAVEMVRGLLKIYPADLALSITGIAGPGGGTTEKQVGHICIAYKTIDEEISTAVKLFKDRMQNKEAAANHALHLILNYFKKEDA